MVKLDRRWWLTADGSRAVPDGDPAAAVLFAAPGVEVPEDRARELGILEPIAAVVDDEPAPAPKPKRAGRKQKVSAEDAAEG